MHPPNKVRIGHMTLAVDFNDGECDALGSDGHTMVGARRITLRSTMERDREREVFLHETLHGVLGAAGLQFPKDEDEERVVSAMTGPLLDMLRRNPKLVRYLTEDD